MIKYKLYNKITSNKTEHLLAESKCKKLQKFNSSLFMGQRFFINDEGQLSLTVQSALLYFKKTR